MTHETIPIESEDASKVHILTGIVIDIGDGVADVNIDDHGVVEDIPVFYHCPDSETADGNPFVVDDRAVIVNYGDAEELSVAYMKVVGFEDGLPRECPVETVYVLFTNSPYKRCFVWDVLANDYASVKKNNGDPAVFPCDPDDISDWYADQAEIGDPLFDEDACGRNRIYTSCSWANWGDTSSSSDSHDEPSSCACGLTDTGSRVCECDASIDCDGKYSGYNKATIEEHLAAFNTGWKLTALNSSGGVTNFREEWLRSYDYEDNSYEEITCDDLPCKNWTTDTSETGVSKFHSPLGSDMFENTAVRVTEFDYCAEINNVTETNSLVKRLQFGAQFTSTIMFQAYLVETNTYTTDFGWSGIEMSLMAQIGEFEDTDNIDPTGLSRNSQFELALNNTFEDLVDISPEQPLLNFILATSILRGLI